MLALQANILVDQTRHARLADFGLTTILSDSTTSNFHARGGSLRWMSPELFDPEIENRQTKHSDCYAFGMVIYEVLSGHVPFYEYPDLVVYALVFRGNRPEKLRGIEGIWFTDDVWKLLERCWLPEPQNRPRMEDVLQLLEGTSKSWTAPSATRSSATPLTAGSSVGWSLGQSTEGGMDASGMPSSSQPVPPQSQEEPEKEEPEKEDSAGIASTVCWVNPLCEF